jgi:DNA-binding NtrC family response regulator
VTPSRQQVPRHFQVVLLELYLHNAAGLDNLLAAAVRRGWQQVALADAVHLTKERIRQRARQGDPDAAGIPSFPGPPLRLVRPLPQRVVKPTLTDGQIADLRAMAEVARRVNGRTPLDHPDRKVSERLSALLNEHVQRDGMSMNYLARVLGITQPAVRHRLSRHGYRPPSPSQAGARYQRAVTEP